MYRTGHVGIALLVYAPLGAGLLLAGRPDLAVLGEVGMVALATLPDYDQRVPLVKHRGSSHTVWFALLVGAVLGTAGWVLGGRPAAPADGELAVFGFTVGTLSVCSHLLGDVLTPMGIRPFWPLWSRTFTLRLTPAKNPIANYGFLVLGVFTTAVVFGSVTGLP